MRPQPVLNRAAIAAGVTLAVTLLKAFGVELPGEFGEQATDAIVTVVTIVSILLAAISARGKVTPLSDPVVTKTVPLVVSEPHDVDDSE